MRQMMAVKDALKHHADIYRPIAEDLRHQLETSGPNLDPEVQQALITQLLGPQRAVMPVASAGEGAWLAGPAWLLCALHVAPPLWT